jgi:hypothetical protein
MPGTATPTAGVITPTTGTTPPTAGTTTLPAGVTPVAGTGSGGGALPAAAGGSLQCGQFVINNYFVTVTTTTTTTNVDAPITAAAGSISTTTGSAASPSISRPSATSAVGRPLRARGSARAGHKRAAKARRVVRVRLSGRTGYAKRVVRVRLILLGHAGRR